jgi:hypothetical protein
MHHFFEAIHSTSEPIRRKFDEVIFKEEGLGEKLFF